MGTDALLELLRDGGLLGVVVILLVVVGLLWKHVVKLNEARIQDSKDHTAMMEEVTEKYITATIQIRATLDNTAKVVDKMCEKLHEL